MTLPVIHRPDTLAEAIELLQRYDGEARVLAGSTALTIMLGQRLIAPPAIIAIGRLKGLDTLALQGDRLVLGALVTHRDVERSDLVRRHAPVLADAFAVVANVRVRNAATVGGVLAEADYASDPPTAFLALDATVHAAGPTGERTIPIAEFTRGFYETALAPSEILTHVSVPVADPGLRGAYLRFTSRSSEDRPCVGVAALLRLDGQQRCQELRVAVGAAVEKPTRFPDLEASAEGRTMADFLRPVAEGYAARLDPIDDLRGSSWYRTEMIRVWVGRAITAAGSPVGGSLPWRD